jgi:hypothetical protein
MMATSRNRGNPVTASRTEIALRALQKTGYSMLVVFVALYLPRAAWAQSQSGFAAIAITPPAVDFIDENFVSMISGKVQFTIPALKMGDVSFTATSYNGYFQAGGAVEDENYGNVVQCENPYGTNFAGVFQCAAAEFPVLQANYGLEHDSFYLTNGAYTPYAIGGNGGDGSAFVDNVSTNGTCTWTQRDGTQIVYYGFHTSGSTLCQANNIYRIIHPDGRIATYYYYGTLSTQPLNPNALLSIATNGGYLLKYNYSGTPAFGAESSVVAINRAFENCNPANVSCTLSNTWPTATLTFTPKTMSVSDNFPSIGPSYNPYLHYIFTIQDSAKRAYVFELDSYSRVISYQPPQASTPVYHYALCSDLAGGTPQSVPLSNCFGQASWIPADGNFYDAVAPNLEWDMVNSVTRNGQVWSYSVTWYPGSPPGYSGYWHQGFSPLGTGWLTKGNLTPGTETQFGPVDQLTTYDGTVYSFERSTRNYLYSKQTPAGVQTVEGYDARGNLWNQTHTPISGSGLSAFGEAATYPSSCTNIVICNKPISFMDGNGNTTNVTYDPNHGGVLTVTGPAVNDVQGQSNVHPQTRYTYIQRNAWYLSGSGMTRDPNPIWVLATESYCMTGPPAASGPGCSLPNDEVLTSYDYGPDSGPNNLLVRGKTVTAPSSGKIVTLRTCYGHDDQGNKIWETSPNAQPSSCPSY